MKQALFILSLPIFWACGDTNTDDDNSGNGEGCNSCLGDELCVIEFSDPKVERCEPIPETCNGIADCSNIDCQAAMYDYCPDETAGWGCSDTAPPTFISCNL